MVFTFHRLRETTRLRINTKLSKSTNEYSNPQEKNFKLFPNEAPLGWKSKERFDYETALTLTILVGLSLLVLNVTLFGILFYRRYRGNTRSNDSEHLCTNEGGLQYSISQTTGSFTTSRNDLPIQQADFQVTELESFQEPTPDIVDQNTSTKTILQRNINSELQTQQLMPPPPMMAVSSSAILQLSPTARGID